MIGIRREIIPVGNNSITFFHFLKDPIGFVQQVIQSVGYEKPGNGAVISFNFMAEDAPDDRPDVAVGGFNRAIDFMPGFFQVFGQQFYLGAFSASINAFKGDKQVFSHLLSGSFHRTKVM